MTGLSTELKQGSEEFYDKYSKGRLADDVDQIEWYNDYRHYLDVHHNVEGLREATPRSQDVGNRRIPRDSGQG